MSIVRSGRVELDRDGDGSREKARHDDRVSSLVRSTNGRECTREQTLHDNPAPRSSRDRGKQYCPREDLVNPSRTGFKLLYRI